MVQLTDSVSQWIQQLRGGDETAALNLWERFFDRILVAARRRRSIDAIVDEEDIAISVFKSLCLGLQQGRFRDLSDRDQLWGLIVVMTVRKLSTERTYSLRARRDRSRLLPSHDSKGTDLIQSLVCSKPTPSLEVEMSDQLQSWLDCLDQRELKEVALLKLAGCTNEEISQQLQRSIATIERKLKLIREIWKQAS